MQSLYDPFFERPETRQFVLVDDVGLVALVIPLPCMVALVIPIPPLLLRSKNSRSTKGYWARNASTVNVVPIKVYKDPCKAKQNKGDTTLSLVTMKHSNQWVLTYYY